MDVYENVFGPDAANAFTKAIRAHHAGIEVTANSSSGASVTCQSLSDAMPEPRWLTVPSRR
jgi:hypothetical protein